MRSTSYKNLSNLLHLTATVCAWLCATSAVAKISALEKLKASDAISFSEFITHNVDVSAFKKETSEQVAPEAEKEKPAIIKSATLSQLRSQASISFGAFVKGKAAPQEPVQKVPTEDVSNTLQVAAEKHAEPVVAEVVEKAVEKPVAKPIVEATTAEPVAIQIAVQDSKGQIKQTSKVVTIASQQASDQDIVTLDNKALTIRVGESHVHFSLKELRFLSKDDAYTVKVLDAKTGKPFKKSSEASLFVRDPSIVQLDNKSMRLNPRKEGSTELYVVANGKAFFLPAVVEKEFNAPKLTMPEEFFALDKATRPQGEQARLSKPAISAGSEALADSQPEILNATERTSDFTLDKTGITYTQARIQVVDERSEVDQKRVYPVPRVKLSLVGTKFSTFTDGLGVATIEDLPTGSRLLLRAEDESGFYRNAVFELDTSKKSHVLTMIRHQALEVYESAINVPPLASAGTLCGIIRDEHRQKTPRAGITVTTDSRSIGPYFFNAYGFLDLQQRAAGPNGKFCFFNVEPGPVSLSFFDGDAYIATLLTAAYANSHNWDDYFIYDPQPVSTKIAMFANAHEQLSSDAVLADSLKLVDMVDLIPLGSGNSMSYIGPGLVEAIDGADLHGGRAFAVSQSSDFETALYPLSADKLQRENVVSLFPRGFIDDMAVYAQVSHNPELGVVTVEHNAMIGQNEGVDVRLLDESGHAVGEGWYYSDFPHTKAIFFNLQPGKYSLIVETKDGYWLAADTVYVFNETMSFVRTGSNLTQK